MLVSGEAAVSYCRAATLEISSSNTILRFFFLSRTEIKKGSERWMTMMMSSKAESPLHSKQATYLAA